jgi:hypothetical protein
MENLVTGSEFRLVNCDGLRPRYFCTWTVTAFSGYAAGPRTIKWRYQMHHGDESFGGALKVTLKVRKAPSLPTPTLTATPTPTPTETPARPPNP